ncbi:MAG: folate-binding protein [Pseudomonadota bacterium]
MPQPQDARQVFKISGDDHASFLQNLVTNDVARTDEGLVYAALLTPQGKYLADFFLVHAADGILLDVAASVADDLIRRLTMYRLRSKVDITPTALFVHRGVDACPEDGHADPRDPSLGWRAYRDVAQIEDPIDWDALRVAACVPQTGVELIPNETYPLEAGFERLAGVDFRKGCYVGQEVTARMKHKTELRKGFATVTCAAPESAPVPVGTPIERDGKTVGTIYTQSGGRAIAFLRFDRTGAGMTAAGVEVTL